MEKLVYLIDADGALPGADLRDGLVEKAAPALRAAGAGQIAVNVEDEHVAAGGAVKISRDDPPIRAMVSFWLDSADDRGPCEDALSPHGVGLAGYLVAESRPLVHQPPVGERAPGANLVTCINRLPGLSDEAFLDHWNNEHRKVALETQSTTAYVRNAVVRALTPGAPVRDGIVEETFPIEALTDPHVWYNCDNEEEYQRRLARMMESVQAFLDFEPLVSVPMSEYFLG